MADGTLSIPITPLAAGTTAAVPANSVAAGTAAGGKLGKNEFLQLLMVQMRNQDPLDPQKPEQSIAQLAQFSSLEQMTNLNSTFASFSRQDGLLQSVLLKGKEVSLQLEGGGMAQGPVESVTWTKDGMQLTVNGTAYSMSNITSLSLVETPVVATTATDPAATTTPSTTTDPII